MVKMLAMAQQKKRSVEAASEMLKRLFFMEKEVMRTSGGYLTSISNWELKKIVPLHMWQDSLRADALRTRVLEMRYPRRDIDQNHDPKLVQFAELLVRCRNDREFVEGAYFVVKRALKMAYQLYLQDADPLDDAPTVAFMKRYSDEIGEQLLDIQDIYPTLAQLHPQIDLWQTELSQLLRDIGGILGVEKTDSLDESRYQALLGWPAYELPLVPVRDPRFEKALYHLPSNFLAEDASFLEHQIHMGINHINEMWACEATATMMWKWDDMPWEFYSDTARWCYDELRHCLMGEERLKAWGFEIGVDIPMVADHYISQSEHGELAILALIHRFESASPGWKSGLLRQFSGQGDTASAQDFDYDWADESIHMQYGHKWLLHRLKGDIDAMEDMLEEAASRWNTWINNARREWDYEPFRSRIQAKIKQLEAMQDG
ncbi:DUF455 family protein [Paenibacillus filicis]|uniref:DUF455 family protein n=1 Tax=Paenibacillus gyeongsangnamensis TaxID=3388067 RepID=A0ABT4Q4E7_9BACL|nr:DUF455 family protein [Paenibacillus filicis]MCZ8511657.1 DUF455 family protein [Paenibacillus filicis]